MPNNNIYIISGGTNYHLAGPGGQTYTGSGTPWTAQATTPYRIANNDSLQPWTPTAPPSQTIPQPAAPWGGQIIGRSFDAVQEQVGVQCYGSNHNNTVALVQQLRKILNPVNGKKALLAVQPSGSTNVAYYRIEAADVQELPDFINSEALSFVARCTVTWTRSAFAATNDGGETLVSSGTMTNTGTGANANLKAFSGSLSGDLSNEGQPANVTMTFSAPTGINEIFLSTAYSREYSTSGSGAKSISGVGVGVAALGHFSIANYIDRPALTPRLMVRITGANNIRLYAYAVLSDGINTGSGLLMRTDWVYPTTAAGVLLDFGPIPSDLFTPGVMSSGGATKIGVYLTWQSITGASAGFTLSYSELIAAYTWCSVKTVNSSGVAAFDASQSFALESYTNTTGYSTLPFPIPRAYRYWTSTGAVMDAYFVRGTAPRAIQGASLYAAWNVSTGHVTSDTATVSATHAPLWSSFRGSD